MSETIYSAPSKIASTSMYSANSYIRERFWLIVFGFYTRSLRRGRVILAGDVRDMSRGRAVRTHLVRG